MKKIVVFCGMILSCTNAISARFSSNSTKMSALMKDIFENKSYNPVIRPTLDHTSPTLVIVEMVIVAILSLDTKKQVLRTNGYIRMSWKDELLQWDPSKYAGLNNIVIPQTMIWVPDVVFNNVVNSNRYLGNEQTRVRVDENGTVRWEPGFNLETTCQVDVTKYPFDVNICPINVFSWMSDNTAVKLQLSTTPLNISKSNSNGEYKIFSDVSKKEEFLSVSKLIYDEVIFHVRLERRPIFFVLSLLMPVSLLSIMCSVSFLLEPDEQDKLTVSITVLLSFTVFLGVIDNNLPETSDDMSLLVVYVSSMLALGFVGVLGNVIIIKVNRWEAEGRVINRRQSVRRQSKRMKANNQSNDLLSEDDGLSNQSDSKRDDDVSECCEESVGCKPTYVCKRRIAHLLNKFFLFVNGSLVIFLTAALWILMLS